MRFHALAAGEGRPILLLHGFPDAPTSFEPMMLGLAAAGFRSLAPFMRGYGPTGPALDEDYSALALGRDVLALLDAWEGGADALVVGHDWGAVAGYAAAVMYPARVPNLVAMSVPPPRALVRAISRNPSQLVRSAYMAEFQLPGASRRLRRDGFARLEAIWRAWSPSYRAVDHVLNPVKRALDDPTPALSYYRALARSGFRSPARYLRAMNVLFARIPARTLVIHGAEDRCIAPSMFGDVTREILGSSRVVRVGGAGHFLPLEAPETCVRAVTRFLEGDPLYGQ